jgi:hypothetical protein
MRPWLCRGNGHQKAGWTMVHLQKSTRNVLQRCGLFSVRQNMDPQIRRWLIALAIGITLFAIGMGMSILHLV